MTHGKHQFPVVIEENSRQSWEKSLKLDGKCLKLQTKRKKSEKLIRNFRSSCEIKLSADSYLFINHKVLAAQHSPTDGSD